MQMSRTFTYIYADDQPFVKQMANLKSEPADDDIDLLAKLIKKYRIFDKKLKKRVDIRYTWWYINKALGERQ